jgi:hypothetical protein
MATWHALKKIVEHLFFFLGLTVILIMWGASNLGKKIKSTYQLVVRKLC